MSIAIEAALCPAAHGMSSL